VWEIHKHGSVRGIESKGDYDVYSTTEIKTGYDWS